MSSPKRYRVEWIGENVNQYFINMKGERYMKPYSEVVWAESKARAREIVSEYAEMNYNPVATFTKVKRLRFFFF